MSTYNFYWEAGTVDGSVEYNGADQYALPDSTYFVYAVNKNPSTPCSSDTAQVVINRTTNNPIITITVISNQTNCKVPDGGMHALAEVDGDTTSTRFNFEWYKSEELLTGTPLSLNPNVTGLQTGSYSVFVEDKISACSATKDQDINADINIPVVVPNIVVQNTSCAAGNGEASAAVSGTGVVYFEDFEDNAISQTSDWGLTSWLRLTNATGGHSSVQNVNGSNVFEVERNGSMRYTYWYSDTIDITGLTNVKFSLEVSSQNIPDWNFGQTYCRIQYRINNGSWITAKQFDYDVNQPHPQIVEKTGLSGSTIALRVYFYGLSNANWKYQIDNITVEGDGNFTDNYIFDWYIGNSVKPTPDWADTDSVSGLPAGNYTVTATSIYTQCNSEPVTLSIIDTLQNFNTTVNVIQPNTSCDPATSNGVVSANVSGDSLNYTFHWFEGQNTLPANELSGSPAQSVSGLTDGLWYTVLAESGLSGCYDTTEFQIPFCFSQCHGQSQHHAQHFVCRRQRRARCHRLGRYCPLYLQLVQRHQPHPRSHGPRLHRHL